MILAEAIGGWIAALGLLIGGATSSSLALAAAYPAFQGRRVLTIALILPAVIMCTVTSHYYIHLYNARSVHSDEEIRENYVEPWLLMGLPPFATSAFSGGLLLWRRTRKK